MGKAYRGVQRTVKNQHQTDYNLDYKSDSALPAVPLTPPSTSSESSPVIEVGERLPRRKRPTRLVLTNHKPQHLADEPEIHTTDIIRMATVRPISPQYQHTLDSAISLAKELASKNMADSGESSPKTPTSPDKKRFNFKLKHLSKSFSEASNNIRDIESTISYEAKQAYKSLVERGPHTSDRGQTSPFSNHHHHLGAHQQQTHNYLVHSTHSFFGSGSTPNEDLSPTFHHNSSKLKNLATFPVKKSFF